MCAQLCAGGRRRLASPTISEPEPKHQIMVYYVGDRASWSILGVDLHGPFTCRVTKPPQSCCLLQRRPPHFPYYNCVYPSFTTAPERNRVYYYRRGII